MLYISNMTDKLPGLIDCPGFGCMGCEEIIT